ncbi:MAG TPA: hypothetical protein VK034_13025 [Enhygromyxa sp.]|nr:hypothetical protein [Enhygromyxa sp.]
MRAALGDAIHQTVQNALLLEVDAECRTRECALRQARDADAEFLLEMTLTFEHRDYAIEIVVIDPADGRPLAEIDEMCRMCAQAELLARIATQVERLRPTLDSAAALPPDEQPPDDPALRPEERRPASRPGLRTGGWVGFTLGLAGVGAGAALIAVDGREHGPTCGAELRDINGACPNVYTTELAGQIGVGLGAAALVTGIALLIASKSKREHERSSAARVSPAPGGLRVEF